MQIRILAFGILKESLGSTASIELPEGSTVAALLDRLRAHPPAGGHLPELRSIAVGVNAEYATAAQVLHNGDEVALLPPVSGGAPQETTIEPITVYLTRDAIASDALIAAAKAPEDGAVTVFDGIVRNHSRGRQTLYLEYEGYEEMALKQMRELAMQSLEKFPVRHVTLVHRLGHMEIGESSVLIVVASAHRGAAFDACRWIIDTLKQTVPIWKKEIFVDGAVWAPGEPFPAEIAIAPAVDSPEPKQ
jgi:molybdopterin synthase catalytic subunit